MYCILNKDMIEMDIVPIISRAKRGFRPTVSVSEIVIAVLYKLKTGFQWNQLPLRALFFWVPLSWQSVSHHYRKWCLSGTWKDCWTEFLRRHGVEMYLTSVGLDGSHT